MFFILKDEKTVLAADEAFLEKANVESIYLLAERFRVGTFSVDETNETCQLERENVPFEKQEVHTVMGTGFLYDLSQQATLQKDATTAETMELPDVTEEELPPLEIAEESFEAHADEDKNLSETLVIEELSDNTASSKSDSLSLPKDEPGALISEEEALPDLLDLTTEVQTSEEASSLAEASLGMAAAAGAGIALTGEDKTVSTHDTEKTATTHLEHDQDHEIFDLVDFDQGETKNEPVDSVEPTHAPIEETETPLMITPTPPPFADYAMNAQLIGITQDDYMDFLSQFVVEAREYEADMRGLDLRLFREKALSLKDASQLLHLPQLTGKLHDIEKATSEEKSGLLDDFFRMIDHLHNDVKEQNLHPEEKVSVKKEPISEEGSETLEGLSEKTTAGSAQSTDNLLAATTPIPFDFSTHLASDELGLPEALVEEFVVDFIKQAKEHIPLFQEAEKNEDLKTIQKTAHLLKGAAANLRIDPLAQTLETLQHNESMSKVPNLLQQFVGQLKSLDNFIHTPSL